MLGLTLDLSGLRNNHSVILKNKEGRVDKISSKILKIKEVGVMSLSDAQEIHGLLNFATGYFAVPQLKNWCDEVFLLFKVASDPGQVQ